MFCYQCRQDSYTRICRVKGICAKDPACVAVEEFLLQGLKNIGIYVKKIREYGGSLEGFYDIALKVFHTSIANVRSESDDIIKILKEIDTQKEIFKERYADIMRQRGFQVELLDQSLYWQPKYNLTDMIREGERYSQKKCKMNSPELNAMLELLLYSIRGIVRHAIQAKTLGHKDIKIEAFLSEVLYSLTQPLSEGSLKSFLDQSGEVGLIALKMLDDGLYQRYGKDAYAKIRISPMVGKSILVSGKDILDLENILKATISKGINVYTHGEMMLAHIFPELRQFPNLIGNYGGVSIDQQYELESFPGPVVITSNCIWDPPEVYRGRVFTTGIPGWPGIQQIIEDDYSSLINAAMDSYGFDKEYPEEFAHIGLDVDKFQDVIGKLEKGIQKGSIRHVFLLVGCSISDMQKNYIADFIEQIPKDCVLIKFTGLKYESKKGIANIDDLPQIIDFGLSDDILSVVEIFLRAKKNLHEIIDPDKISTIFFLQDQNAIAILLSLLQFRLKSENIRIGTCAPSLLPPTIFKALDRTFGIKSVSSPEADINELLGG